MFGTSPKSVPGKKRNTHNSCRRVSNPQPPASEWPQTHALDRAATAIGPFKPTRYNFTNTNFFVAPRRCSWPPCCHNQFLQVFDSEGQIFYDKYLRIPFSFTDACACFQFNIHCYIICHLKTCQASGVHLGFSQGQ